MCGSRPVHIDGNFAVRLHSNAPATDNHACTRALQPFGDDRSSSSVRSLSCVLWSMLTGKRFCSRISNMPSRLPFRNASELSYLYRHGFEGDGSVSSLPPVNVVGTRADCMAHTRLAKHGYSSAEVLIAYFRHS